MRTLLSAVLLLLLASTHLLAQLPPTEGALEFPQNILSYEVPGFPDPPQIVEPPIPQDFVVPETGIPEIFPPAEQAPGNFINIEGENVRIEDIEGGQLVTARDNVTATYKNITVTSSTGTYDSRSETAVFEGNVAIRIDGQVVRGERLKIDLTSRMYTVQNPSTTLPPSFFISGVVEPVFLSSGTLTGVGRQRFTATDSNVTTCNLEDPHYIVSGREVIVLPQQKIIVKKATVYALDRKLFTIPRLVIPLRNVRSRSNIIPQIGQSVEEGYYLKTAYNYLGSPRQTGLLKLDLMSKKGIAQGIEQAYNFAKAAGSVYLYNLYDKNLGTRTFTGRIDHKQKLGGIDMQVTSSYRDNSYLYAPQTKSWGTDLLFQRNRPTADSTLAIRRDLDTGIGRFASLTSSFEHRQSFSPESNLQLGLDYSTYDQPQTSTTGETANVTQGQLVSRAIYNHNYRLFDLGVSATKINDISDEAFIGSGFAGIERLPEVEISSDNSRLGRTLPYNIPLRATFSAGKFTELPVGTDSNRFFLQMDSSAQRYEINDKLSLTAGAGFRQFLYDTDAAQYVVDTSEELVYKVGDNSSAGLGYRYMRPRGFTPFRFDQISRYNMLNGRFTLQETEKFKFGLVTGYNLDVDDFPWQDIAIRTLYAPSENYALYASTGYDPNTGRWRSLLNQFRVRFPDTLRLDIGTRYDIEKGKFGSVKTALDWQIGSKWRVQGFVGYNGFTKQFDYQNFRIQRDLHCWVASLTYADRGGIFDDKSITLSLSIKAFPIFENFGLGQFGQPLDTSVGQIY